MGTDTLIVAPNGKIVTEYKEGTDPYRPGVDVVYDDGTKENLRMDIYIFKERFVNKWKMY